MLKDMIKARPTSRGMYSSSINTRVVQTLVRPFGACTRVWTTLLLIPDLVLPSQLVLSIYHTSIQPCCATCMCMSSLEI